MPLQLLMVSLCFAVLMMTSACQTSSNKYDSSVATNESAETPIPNSSKITTGQFANGMTYIIRKKSNVKNHAHLQLLVKVGSLLEDDQQRGFAHFTEHMAFNGTKDFPKHALVDYFESVGMKFGHGMNASTRFDRTLYKLYIPTDDKAVFEKGFQVLENWAHKISFDPQEVEKERGVILEEWRRKDSANNRLRKKHNKALYAGTVFEDRVSIGLPEIIEHGKIADLTRFYQQWYQPQNMVVVAVGDFDTSQVKALMEKYLAAIPVQQTSKSITHYAIPEHTQTIVSIATDPETVSTNVSIRISEPRTPSSTFASQAENIKKQLVRQLLAQRLAEAIRMESVGAISSKVTFYRGLGQRNLLVLAAKSKPEQSQQTLTFLLEETYRAAQHGFTEQEFARMKSIFIQKYEKLNKGVTSASKLVKGYVARAVNEEPFFDNQSLSGFWLKKLHEISVDELNEYARSWLQRTDNRSIVVSAPDAERDSLPSKQAALAIWQQASSKTYQPYQADSVPKRLITTLPAKGEIVERRFDDRYDSHIWQLNNGAKVVLHRSKRRTDKILFQATRRGGLSLLDAESYRKSARSAPYLDYMGVSNLSANMLKKFLIDKQIKLKTTFSKTEDKLNGESSVKDIDHFMQLVHLKFVAPRKDQQDFKRATELGYANAEKRFNSPLIRFIDALHKAGNEHNPRYISPYNPESIRMLDLNVSYQSYQQHFANAGDFTFVFTGDIEIDKMDELVTTYIASLPSRNDRKSNWLPLPDRTTKGHRELHLKEGNSQKALVIFQLFGDVAWSEETQLSLHALSSSLNLLLREKIREELGGTYSIKVKGTLSKEPTQRYDLVIHFNCEPERVDELVNALRTELARVQREGIPNKLLENFKRQQLHTRELALQTDHFWLKNLGTLQSKPIFALDDKLYNRALKGLSVDQLNMDIMDYLNAPNTVYATLLPENSTVTLTSIGKKSALALE